MTLLMALKVWVLWFMPAFKAGSSVFSSALVWPPLGMLPFFFKALIKARAAAQATGLPAIADDSGIEVAALGGAPGVRSARYAGGHCDDAANNTKLLDALAGERRRQARFRCVCVCLRHADDPAPLIAQGVWPGSIVEQPRGVDGFGYDPMFLPAGEQRTAAELTADEKNRASHRGQAVAALVTQLRIEPL